MSTQEIDERICDSAITLAFSVLGKRWNGMILGVLGSGSASFVSLRKAVSGISDTVLSDRLVELVEAGLVRREVAEGHPSPSATNSPPRERKSCRPSQNSAPGPNGTCILRAETSAARMRANLTAP
ncbi:MAG: helix-turn-helix domain-containing protein [Galbitalea sp.]